MMHMHRFYESSEGICLYSPRIREELFSETGLNEAEVKALSIEIAMLPCDCSCMATLQITQAPSPRRILRA